MTNPRHALQWKRLCFYWTAAMFKRFGATRLGVWLIKHLVAPIDRQLYRLTGGRLATTGQAANSILLLTTIGRRSGQPRTTPVFFWRDQQRVIICNVNPGFEQTNPWVLNLRAQPIATVQIGAERYTCHAREATPTEIEAYWPCLTRRWPAYQAHYERSGQRTLFVLEDLHTV